MEKRDQTGRQKVCSIKITLFVFISYPNSPSNAIDLLCSGSVPKAGIERQEFENNFEEIPEVFTPEEREAWLKKLGEVAVSSDAFYPFPDNIYRLSRSGV